MMIPFFEWLTRWRVVLEPGGVLSEVSKEEEEGEEEEEREGGGGR